MKDKIELDVFCLLRPPNKMPKVNKWTTKLQNKVEKDVEFLKNVEAIRQQLSIDT